MDNTPETDVEQSSVEIKLIKLDNNDMIIAQISEDSYGEYDLFMIDPVQVQIHQFQHHGKIIETYSLKPWIPLTDDCVLEVPYNKILNTSCPSDNVIDRYIEFLTDEEDLDFNEVETKANLESNEEELTDYEDEELAELLDISKSSKTTYH